jgi:hypothetical protein
MEISQLIFTNKNKFIKRVLRTTSCPSSTRENKRLDNYSVCKWGTWIRTKSCISQVMPLSSALEGGFVSQHANTAFPGGEHIG